MTIHDHKELRSLSRRIFAAAGVNEREASVAEQFAAGNTTSIVTDMFPLDDVNEALGLLRSGQVLGRCVLQIG